MKIIDCPVCREKMLSTQLYCEHCDILIDGKFEHDRFAYLDNDTADFLEVFVLARGNIKEIEKQLGISYPTVRAKIDRLVEAVIGIKEIEEQQLAKEQKAKADSERKSRIVKSITRKY
ncbi:MAG: DUF2089 domain-containing protein [FCB group bacterium]|nr:DUF2089 domain-containing protein [FCB group bacterium]